MIYQSFKREKNIKKNQQYSRSCYVLQVYNINFATSLTSSSLNA